MLKKIISAAAALFTAMSLAGCSLTEREVIEETHELHAPPRVMFLGDSIAAGYGLDGYTADDNYSCPDSYANILKEKYTAELAEICDHEMQNFAVSGATSSDLLELLESGKLDSALAETDAVVISIGGNDLLANVMTIVEALGVTKDNKSVDLDNIDFGAILSLMGTFENDVSASLDLFEENLKTIARTVNEKTDGKVYIQTLYNPLEVFTDLPVVSDFSARTLNDFNEFIDYYEGDYDYRKIDIAEAFNGRCDELTRINEIDIHPNEAGHKLIAELVDETLSSRTYYYTTQLYGKAHLTVTAIILIAGGIIVMLSIVVVIIPKLFKKYEK